MLLTPERIFVPTGRTPFVMFERDTGKQIKHLGESDSWGKNLIGGSFAVVVDDRIVTGPSEDGQMHVFNMHRKESVIHGVGNQLIVNGMHSYMLQRDSLTCFGRKAYHQKGEKAVLWQSKVSNALTMLMSGEQIVVGGMDEVSVFDAVAGDLIQTLAVSGRAEGLSVLNGNLLVSTDSGVIHCFGDGAEIVSKEEITVGKISQPTGIKALSKLGNLPDYTEKAKKGSRGYCLVLGCENIRTIERLVNTTNCRIVAADYREEHVRKVRAYFAERGLYGSRVVAHLVSVKNMPYRQYIFNHIVCSLPSQTGELAPSPDELYRVLRPDGGELVVEAGITISRDDLQAWSTNAIPGFKVKCIDNWCSGSVRRPALPEAGEWGHAYADTGNTACSGQNTEYGPMAIQWFGRPGPRKMVDRHQRAQPPLCVGGRLFISGDDYVAAADAYNGTILWERDMPGAGRYIVHKQTSNMVATTNRLLIAEASGCMELNPETGEQLRIIPLPENRSAAGREWGYLAVAEGVLVGSSCATGTIMRSGWGNIDYFTDLNWRNNQPLVCSQEIFAHDLNHGRLLWRHAARAGAIVDQTITVIDGIIYFVCSINAETLKGNGRNSLADLFDDGAMLTALDLYTGQELWSQAVDLSNLEHIVFMSSADDVLVISGSKYISVNGSKKKRIRYELHGYDCRDGRQLWQQDFVPAYDDILSGSHGEQVQHPAIVTGIVYGSGFACYLKTGEKYEGWTWRKGSKCGTVALSETCAFSRFAGEKLPYIFDRKTGDSYPMTTVSRPGCWINMLPAAGLVLIPEASSGCTCGYSMQTSIALSPTEEEMVLKND